MFLKLWWIALKFVSLCAFQCVAGLCGLVISVSRRQRKNCSRSWTNMEKQLSGSVYCVLVIEYISAGCSVWVPAKNLAEFCLRCVPKMMSFWFSGTMQCNLVLAFLERYRQYAGEVWPTAYITELCLQLTVVSVYMGERRWVLTLWSQSCERARLTEKLYLICMQYV